MTDPQYLSPEAAADSGQPNIDIWRKELHSRVARFRARRDRRIEGAFSMRFPFPPNQSATHLPSVPSETVASDPGVTVAEVDTTGESSPLAAATEAIELAAESIPAAETPDLASEPVGLAAEALVAELPQAEVEPQPVIQARPRPKRKVIAFPRQPAAEIVHQLADPVLTEQPRILDVPEELEAYPTTPFLDGLQFEPADRVPTSPASTSSCRFGLSISQNVSMRQ